MENTNGLGKLLPKSITSKRRRKKQGQEEEDLRQSVASYETHDDDDDLFYDEDKGYESDHDSSSLTRPSTVSAHPSQLGYLTSSFPAVQASHLAESITDRDSNSSSRSLTFPAQRSDSVESKESSRLGRTKTGLLPPHNPTKRSPSPGGKFKGIFKPKKSSVSSSSPERRASIEHPPPPISNKQQATPAPTESNSNTEAPLVPPIIEPPAAAKVASPERRSRIQPKVDTKLPPRTPPTGDKPAPVIVNTPPTPVDVAYTSGRSSPERRSFWGNPTPAPTSNGNSSSRAMSVHRRSRSSSVNIGPSKLSNITNAPLTPTTETEEATPNPNANPNAGSGFFSSMFSVAQNAASTLSNNIQSTGIGLGGTKSRSNTGPKVPDLSISSDPEVRVEPSSTPPSDDPMEQQRESTLRTLGSGDLSLSQLGLSETPKSVATPMSAKFPDVSDTRARSESAPADAGTSTSELLPEDPQSRPRSLQLTDPAPIGDRTPPQPEFQESKSGVQRSSSIRSALKQPHRKRGSSATTGTTIGAAIATTNNSLSGAHPNLSAPKLTGFAIASKKRNREFHELFKSVPDDDYLIEDYSCALQREILAHGRLYVSEGHLCFSSNILGWSTTLVMSFDEIVSVEKRSTALVFKNGLMISTLHAKHVFASFTSRDATYDLIVNIWKLGHPTLQSTLNGIRLEGTGGDKTEKVDIEPAAEEEDEDGTDTDGDIDDEEEDFYDEDVHDEIHANLAEVIDGEGDKAASRKPSGAAPALGGPATDAAASSGATGDFPGPATHVPTDCGDSSSHYDRVVGDDVVQAPLGKVYNLIFGAGSATFMSQWLTGDQKCTELQMEDKKGLSLENRTRTFTYIKPLNGAIGPKQTKCITSETLENLDFEKAANLVVSTQTPDVPSGNVFCVKTKYCLSWAENNATRVQINCTIEWSGKSWIKGPIEKGATDGQTQYSKDLFAALKAAVTARPVQTGPVLQSALKGRRKARNKKPAQLPPGGVEGGVVPKKVVKKSWGLLEPFRGILEPITDIIQPLLTGNVMYGLLVGLLVAAWFGFGFSFNKSPSYGQDMRVYRPERIAAYEEMWRRQDSELWDWLDERIGFDRLHTNRHNAHVKSPEPRSVEEKLKAAQMDEREVQEAIRVTEEKLQILKGVMEKKKRKRGKNTGDEIPGRSS